MLNDFELHFQIDDFLSLIKIRLSLTLYNFILGIAHSMLSLNATQKKKVRPKTVQIQKI